MSAIPSPCDNKSNDTSNALGDTWLLRILDAGGFCGLAQQRRAASDLGRIRPAAVEDHDGGGLRHSIYRVFQDESGLTIFAYELVAERTPDGERMHITARPVGAEFARSFPSADGGKPTPTLPDARELPLLGSGERSAIEVFTVPTTGVKVIDTVEIRLNRGGAPASAPAITGARLRFAGVRVYINRTLALPTGRAAVVAGPYAMFYIPGQGAYIFSTDAPEGRNFIEAGWVAARGAERG